MVAIFAFCACLYFDASLAWGIVGALCLLLDSE